MDFVTDILYNKRRFRDFTIIDDYKGKHFIWVLNHLINRRGKPDKIRMDNGPEFIANLASEWSQMHGVEFQYIQPGKPTQNALKKELSLASLRSRFKLSLLISVKNLLSIK